jgi:hypothetical protein
MFDFHPNELFSLPFFLLHPFPPCRNHPWFLLPHHGQDVHDGTKQINRVLFLKNNSAGLCGSRVLPEIDALIPGSTACGRQAVLVLLPGRGRMIKYLHGLQYRKSR